MTHPAYQTFYKFIFFETSSQKCLICKTNDNSYQDNTGISF